jgi:quercetin dioxygenase-like cupin family protein
MHVPKARYPMRIFTVLAVCAALLSPFSGAAQAPAAAAIAGAPLLANDRISAIKLSFPPGARESMHSHPFDIVVIQLTAGEVDVALNGDKSVGHIEAGRVTYVPAQAQHAVGNSGSTPFEMVVVGLK